jgi:hypothetical protein
MVVVGLVCPMAYGEESNSNSDWEFNLAPMYLWAVSIDGDQTVKGVDVDLDVPFSEIFDKLKGFTEIMFELAGFYRITEGAHAIDGLGGLRYSSMDVDLDLPAPLPNVDQGKDWVDPYLGLRWQWKFAEKWGTDLRGDIGGFGIGSDITWNLVGMVKFKPWKHVGLFGGYRALYQDYSTGSGDNKF